MTLVERYYNLTVSRKLLLIIMTTVSLALLLACAGVFTYSRFMFREAVRSDLISLADMYGSNSTAALTFGDQKAAAELLSGFRAKRSIVSAAFYTQEGIPVASYHRDADAFAVPRVQLNSIRFDRDRLRIFRPILLDGRSIGTVYLESDLGDVNRRLMQSGLALVAILLSASIVAFLLATKLKTAITEPIRELAQTAKHVATNKDYRSRAKKLAGDDLGLLTDRFNGMLAEIEARDRELLANQQLLEKKVGERTAELALAKDKAETACVLLDQSRARLSVALDGASEALWDCDLKTKQTYYSERWSAMLGFSPEEIGNTRDVWDGLVHPDDYDKTLQSLQNHLEGRTEGYQAEFRMRTKDGGYRWVQARGKVVEWAADGSPARIAGTHLDITERKESERALARQHYILESLIESVPDHIYFKDRDSRFIRVNRAMVRLFGANDPSELIGKGDADFFTAEHAGQALADEKDLLDGRQFVISKEERETWPDGRESWVQTTKLPLRDNAGRIIGTFGISRDITERKRMEQDLRAAKEAAEAGSRAKSEFLANMSHEIRTPMNGIIGMTELALETDLTEEQRDYLKTVRSSGESLLTIINDILDFSKIEAGRLALDSAEFDLDDLLQETVRGVALSAHQKGLELLYENRVVLPALVEGDSGRIRQVVINLLANAVKFTSSGEVALRVSEVSSDQKRRVLQFTISDTGIGVAPEWRERIFEAFVQADASSKRSYGGTGLGLAICSRLVALMGGRIWLESRIGAGSAFHFTVNVGISDTQRNAVLSAEPEALHGLSVLIVDDNATNRRILQETLTAWRMKPVLAESGPKALETLHSYAHAGDRFDLVLLDAQMPEMDGFTLARHIREDLTLVGPRIMMVSSIDVKVIGSDLSEFGLAHYVVKPVTRSNLLKALLKVMGGGTPEAIQRSRAMEAGPRAQLHILVAEDNPVNQRVAQLLLKKLGHSVVLTANGAEALDAVARESFDLIFMDVQMPVLNGYEATREIRKRERVNGLHTPIIALTAHAVKGDREICLDAGMDDYLSKPIQARDLHEVVTRWGPRHATVASGPL